jgi:quaternary ammonium compound-resistance protein SugE
MADLRMSPAVLLSPECSIIKGGYMSWVILVLAGLFEIAWAIGLKYTEGFTRLWPSVWTLLTMAVSVWLLGIAMKSLPVGTAYSVWVGIGAVGTVVFGIVVLGESTNVARLLSVALIIAGVVGLRLTAPS